MAPEGWHTGEQIRDHKLAASIINGHGDPTNEVFDPTELDLLKRFCVDPSTSTRDAILAERGWIDESGAAPGTKAADAGSLTCFCIARYGTENPAFDERDIQMLQEWFERGAPTGEHVTR